MQIVIQTIGLFIIGLLAVKVFPNVHVAYFLCAALALVTIVHYTFNGKEVTE